MEKIHGNVHVFVLSHKKCYKNMRVSVYFLHLVLAFTPHYIIMDKGLLLNIWLTLIVPWQPYKSKAPPCTITKTTSSSLHYLLCPLLQCASCTGKWQGLEL